MSEFPQSVSSPTPGSQYDRDYYETSGRVGPIAYCRENPQWLRLSGVVADKLVRLLRPERVLDVGCGKGFLVECLRDRGIAAFGFDISEYAISEVRADLKAYCWVGSAVDSIKEDYDLITCVEVCEHLPEAEANEAVRQMTIHSNAVLFSSTPSDFTEPTHINVRPVIDWLRVFARFSFAPDERVDASFLAPQAVLFRRAECPPPDRSLCRFAYERTRAVAAEELRSAPEIRGELDAILNSKAWKLIRLYRSLRSRLSGPIAEALRLSNLHPRLRPNGNPRVLPGTRRIQRLFLGKKALEIGGPSQLFGDGNLLPVYQVLASADNCLFAERTIWTGAVQGGRTAFEFHPGKASGTQLICEASDLAAIPDSTYESVLASHCLEHVANPLRALQEWKRVLVDQGLLLLVLPHKDGTFDWRRPVTPLEHMIQDYERNTGEDDLTHLPEVLALHDLEKDPPAGSLDQFEERCLANRTNRAMHHHVFDTMSAVMLVDRAGFLVKHAAAVEPLHIVVVASKPAGRADNSRFLHPDATFLGHSPFRSDQRYREGK